MSEEVKRICPHCGGNQFMAYIKRGGIVESSGVDENGNPKFKILKEGARDNYEVEIIQCVKCKNPTTVNDLTAGTKCKTCGEFMNPEDLNENGVCYVCAAMEADPTLKNASPRELLRRFLKGGATNASKKADKAAAAAKTVEEKAAISPVAEQQEAKSADDMLNDMLNGQSGATAEEPKTKRKKAARGKAAAEPSPLAEEPWPGASQGPEQQSEETAKQDIAGAQEAPFPDVPGMNPTETVPPVQQDTGFQMFDDDTEQPF